MPDTPWHLNDDLFRRELATGHRFAEYAADQLRQRGVEVAVTPMQFRRDLADAERFSDEHDLTVEGRRVDVKSRRLSFNGPEDFPFETAIVDTVDGWDRKLHKPVAVLLVSQMAGGIAVVPCSTAEEWQVVSRFDSVRRIEVANYELDRQRLRTLGEFVGWLREDRCPVCGEWLVVGYCESCTLAELAAGPVPGGGSPALF